MTKGCLVHANMYCTHLHKSIRMRPNMTHQLRAEDAASRVQHLQRERRDSSYEAPHFLRLMTLEHMSIKPTFASLSGKLEMARAALSTYSCASALVCSMPSLWITISRACKQWCQNYREIDSQSVFQTYLLHITSFRELPPNKRP